MVSRRSIFRCGEDPPTLIHCCSAVARARRLRGCGSRSLVSGILWHVIGILGGTFDPPHIAHLAIAHAAHEQLGLAEILLMPAGDPWQKAGDALTDAGHRMAMTRLAASEAPYLVADDSEMRREGPTYTIDTIMTMTERCVLILGADAAAGVPTWHRAAELMERVTFAVILRPGIDTAEVDTALGDRYTWIDLPAIDISSTDIRDHVARGHSARFLVPEAVAAYIEANNLYSVATSSDKTVSIIVGDE
ncbi:MAG: hypothetical protein BMS9Abin20_0152 [Acidimicrobiia bacterium]|nr:MAG: hypothetical protein BMS9Abin20_0152 [Acidimicrobiia bacterium]